MRQWRLAKLCSTNQAVASVIHRSSFPEAGTVVAAHNRVWLLVLPRPQPSSTYLRTIWCSGSGNQAPVTSAVTSKQQCQQATCTECVMGPPVQQHTAVVQSAVVVPYFLQHHVQCSYPARWLHLHIRQTKKNCASQHSYHIVHMLAQVAALSCRKSVLKAGHHASDWTPQITLKLLT